MTSPPHPLGHSGQAWREPESRMPQPPTMISTCLRLAAGMMVGEKLAGKHGLFFPRMRESGDWTFSKRNPGSVWTAVAERSGDGTLAPFANNICERVRKKALLHRKGSLFYKTENGAPIDPVDPLSWMCPCPHLA